MCSPPTGSSPALARWSSRRRAILRRFSFLFFSLFFLLFAILEKAFLLLFLAFFSSSVWHTWEGEATSDSEIISPLKIFVITWYPPQIVVTNSLPQGLNVARMGSKLEVIDISGEIFRCLFFSSWFGFQGMVSEFIRRSHYNESVGRTRFYFNRFQINSVKGERTLWPLLQADRQGGGEQGEENQRRRNFLFFIQCHLKIFFLLLGTNNSRIHNSSSHFVSH